MRRESIGVTDIGLRSDISVGGVFFGAGVTRALSHVDGTELVLIVTSMRCMTTGVNSLAQYLYAQYGTPCRPGEVFFKEDSILYTSYSHVMGPDRVFFVRCSTC